MRFGGSSRGNLATLVSLVALAVATAGCSSTKSLLGFGDKSQASASSSGTTGAANPPGLDDLDCPNMEVRTGASTLLIGSKSMAGDPAATDLKYQGTLVRTARECTPNATTQTMTMKIGIEGRVITGMAGGPGHIDVPVRIAVVHEGPQPRTVLAKLYRIPVDIGPGQDHVNFTQIDPDIAFPLPKPASEISSYIVYVGFDPSAAAPERKKPAPKRKR